MNRFDLFIPIFRSQRGQTYTFDRNYPGLVEMQMRICQMCRSDPFVIPQTANAIPSRPGSAPPSGFPSLIRIP